MARLMQHLSAVQVAEQLVALAPATHQAALRDALQQLMLLVRAEMRLAQTLDLLQVERALSDRFQD